MARGLYQTQTSAHLRAVVIQDSGQLAHRIARSLLLPMRGPVPGGGCQRPGSLHRPLPVYLLVLLLAWPPGAMLGKCLLIARLSSYVAGQVPGHHVADLRLVFLVARLTAASVGILPPEVLTAAAHFALTRGDLPLDVLPGAAVREHGLGPAGERRAVVPPRPPIGVGQQSAARGRLQDQNRPVLRPGHLEGVSCKSFRLKQYLKDGVALRIETVINSPKDLRCNRQLANLPELQDKALINGRLLETETVGQGTALVSPVIERITRPALTGEGWKAPALRFGDLRVQALAGATAAMLFTVTGITNRSLRALMTGLLHRPYSMNQASYDLSRLARTGLIRRIPGRNRYTLTRESCCSRTSTPRSTTTSSGRSWHPTGPTRRRSSPQHGTPSTSSSPGTSPAPASPPQPDTPSPSAAHGQAAFHPVPNTTRTIIYCHTQD